MQTKSQKKNSQRRHAAEIEYQISCAARRRAGDIDVSWHDDMGRRAEAQTCPHWGGSCVAWSHDHAGCVTAHDDDCEQGIGPCQQSQGCAYLR